MSRTVRRRLRAICSYKLRGPPSSSCSVLHGHRTPSGRLLYLEELPWREPAHPGHDARREALDERVQLRHLVVVELTGEGDLRFGPGQLLLERQEVLAGLELGVVLRHRDQAADPAGQLVLGLGL